jgi:hypothetical protein
MRCIVRLSRVLRAVGIGMPFAAGTRPRAAQRVNADCVFLT